LEEVKVVMLCSATVTSDS